MESDDGDSLVLLEECVCVSLVREIKGCSGATVEDLRSVWWSWCSRGYHDCV